MTCDHLFTNYTIATMMADDGPYGLIHHGALAMTDDCITWVGPMDQLPSELTTKSTQIHNSSGALMTPGLIDCHTHLVYSGDRYHELALRLQGLSYQQITEQGGGIHATVRQTRAASSDSLLQETLTRARHLWREGVLTIEIKSGYGLDQKTELTQLMVAKQLPDHLPIDVITTYLGAHLCPDDQPSIDAYLNFICDTMIPYVAQHKLASAVDAFCENIAFNTSQCERIFKTAQKHQLAIKIHAEQLSCLGGAALAAQYHALSADHLEYIDEAGILAMAQSGTVAVLLPGAYYFLQETQKPPISLLKSHHVPIAIATDANPGSSPTHSLLLMMNMACVLWGLSPEDALSGVTVHAARALGLTDRGTLAPGQLADCLIWDTDHPDALSYHIQHPRPQTIIKKGQLYDNQYNSL